MRATPLCLIAFVSIVGCGRTTLEVGPPDGGPPRIDAGRDSGRDAGRDAGPTRRRDAGHDAGYDGGYDAGHPIGTCRRDAHCDTGVCRAFASDPAVDLVPIALDCGARELDPSGAPGSPCRDRVTCDRHLCTVSGTCVIPCVSDEDCADTEICRQVYVTTALDAMQPLDACTALVAAPASVATTGPERGPTLRLTSRPDVVTGLGDDALIVWHAPGHELYIGQIRSRPAPGEVLFDYFFAGGPGDPAPDWGVYPTATGDVVTVLFPNGPNTPALPMGLTADLAADRRTPSERLLFQRSGEGTVLDIDVYLIGGGGWTSPDGSVPSELMSALDEAEGMLVPVGLRFGDVRVHEVVGGLRARLEIVEDDIFAVVPPDLPDVFRLSAGANRPSIHIFFVRFIDGALGLASGIPGPHVMPGTGASGVAVAVDPTPPELLPTVIVHEIGHFVGLFHTSEMDGSVFEPLTDTPECRSTHDVDRDGILRPEECAGAGGDNLMFWAGSGMSISPQQAELMRRAYFVR